MNPNSRREDPTELARPSGVVTTGTAVASAKTESGTEGGEAPVAEKEAQIAPIRCCSAFAVHC